MRPTYIALLLAPLALFGASAHAADPCTPLSAPGALWNPTTGAFNVRRPTTQGDLLICGTIAFSNVNVRAHILGSTDIWSIVSTEAGSNPHVTVTFGTLGAITYQFAVPSAVRTLTSSTVTNCGALSSSQTFAALKEAYNYFNALAKSGVGTTAEQDLNLAMTETLVDYLTSPQLVADCQDYLNAMSSNPGACAWDSCGRTECSNCCESSFDSDIAECDAKYAGRSWWGKIKRWLGILTESQAICYNTAEIKANTCTNLCISGPEPPVNPNHPPCP